MDSVIPKHIPHALQETMNSKSSIHWLGILLKNETCYSDCVQIMDEYERQISQWYTKAGRGGEIEDLRVPVGGDQLTRVRLQGAKALRNGSLTSADRLEHLNPVIVEMFHTLQDFLEKLYKRFYKNSSGRDKGTLHHLKILIQRSNVNGNVKSRFEAHEDFVLTVGCAYWLAYIQKHFDMKDLDDEPKHDMLKKNIKMMHFDKKQKLFDDIMDELIDPLVQTYSNKESEVTLCVKIAGNECVIKSHPQDNISAFTLCIQNVRYIVNVKPEEARNGAKLSITTPSGTVIPIEISILKKPQDDFYNYVFQLMQWYMLILNFKDTIKEGDIYRNNVNLKFCIPLFFSHSALSKYFIECIDYILKTEALLSEKMALQVRCASFVNPKGRQGKNKAADLQKENQVLVLKELIRGLGSNKTENAIKTVSKAAPVIQDIVNNFDKMLSINNKQTRHQKKSFQEDVTVILDEILTLDPWTEKDGRALVNFERISKTPFTFHKKNFENAVLLNVQRLKRGFPETEPDSDTDEES